MKKPEILAPAGNMDCLKSAIAGGCDAVYLGGNMFGARAYSANFTNDEIIEAVKYAHKYGVKIYVTVNTIVYEAEVENFMKYIDFLYVNNVDAVIVQDIGMMDLIRQTYPDFDVHASTQMHIHSYEGVKLVSKLGLTRVVLARETTIEDIKKIKENTNIELEIFVHGALCVCYSGQCLMSSLIGGRSGNRGTCAQPCRREYDVLDSNKNKVNKDKYNLSPKDLNSLENIKYLIEAGVDSLKIEGRMKSPSYVYLVVMLYKKAVDSYLKSGKVKIDPDEIKKLMVTFNRQYTKGFMFHEDNNKFINPYRSNHQGIEIGKIVKVSDFNSWIKLSDDLSINDGIRITGSDDTGFILTSMFLNNKKVDKAKKGDIVMIKTPIKISINNVVLKTLDYNLNKEIDSLIAKEDRYVKINGKITIKENSKMVLEVSDGLNKVKVVSNNIVTKAINNPTLKNRVYQQITKTGLSVYVFDYLDIEYSDNLFIPIKDLNELRRKALEKLDDLRIDLGRNNKKHKYFREVPSFNRKKEKCLYIISNTLLNKIDFNKYDKVYLNKELFDVYKEKYDNVYLKLPRVLNKYDEYDSHLLVGELGSVNKYEDIDTDFSLNVVNSYSVAFLHSLGVKKVCLSYELNEYQIKKLVESYEERYKQKPNLEMIIYGREEIMISKFNVLKYYNLHDEGYLRDKFNNYYKVKEIDGLMYIYNSKIRNIKEIQKYYDMGVNSFRYNIVDIEDLNYI